MTDQPDQPEFQARVLEAIADLIRDGYAELDIVTNGGAVIRLTRTGRMRVTRLLKDGNGDNELADNIRRYFPDDIDDDDDEEPPA